jgi:hypothetical protein
VAQSSFDELHIADGASLGGREVRDRPIQVGRPGKFVPRDVARSTRGTFFPLGGNFVPRRIWDFASGTLFPARCRISRLASTHLHT